MKQKARTSGSLARREARDPATLTRGFIDIGNQAAEDINQADIALMLKALDLGAKKKSKLEELIAMLTPAQDTKGLLSGLFEASATGLGTYLGKRG